jgi:phenylpropionate dioxygenase-like ring-hydroxylating dioxygenase large terminal subunit
VTDDWTGVLASSDLPTASIAPVEYDGSEVVVFRTQLGVLGAVERRCPHLDADLADGAVIGEDLVCLAHGWSILVDGTACKRNEFGRVDPKGATRAWQVCEQAGMICLRSD